MDWDGIQQHVATLAESVAAGVSITWVCILLVRFVRWALTPRPLSPLAREIIGEIGRLTDVRPLRADTTFTGLGWDEQDKLFLFAVYHPLGSEDNTVRVSLDCDPNLPISKPGWDVTALLTSRERRAVWSALEMKILDLTREQVAQVVTKRPAPPAS